MDERALIGSCGLYCGLCPRYQSKAASRCSGCQSGKMGAYCAVFRCASKRGYLTCAECPEYPCTRLRRALKTDEGLDSFVSHKPALPNLEEIKKDGLDSFLKEQRKRRLLAEDLIANYNAGRSMTLYCTACALMPTRTIERAINTMEKSLAKEVVEEKDRKKIAKTMRKLIEETASDLGIDLALQRKERR